MSLPTRPIFMEFCTYIGRYENLVFFNVQIIHHTSLLVVQALLRKFLCEPATVERWTPWGFANPTFSNPALWGWIFKNPYADVGVIITSFSCALIDQPVSQQSIRQFVSCKMLLRPHRIACRFITPQAINSQTLLPTP